MASNLQKRNFALVEDMKGKNSASWVANARNQRLEMIQTYIRDNNTQELDSSSNYEDLDQLISSVRALIATNTEIWERCNESRVENVNDKAASVVSFHRFGYFSIRAYTECTHLYFDTTPELEVKKFHIYPTLPTILCDIVVKPKNMFSGVSFPRFDLYLNQIFLLEESIMKPILIVFKRYLHDVQLSLGEIDSWLLEPSQNVTFLNDRFNSKLEMPELVGCHVLSGCEWPHHESSICIRCFKKRSDVNLCGWSCHGICSAAANVVPSVVRCSYICSSPVLLNKFIMKDGNFTKTFHISKERERLTLFVAFAKA